MKSLADNKQELSFYTQEFYKHLAICSKDKRWRAKARRIKSAIWKAQREIELKNKKKGTK